LLVDDAPEAESYVARPLRPDLPLANVLRIPGQAELSEALAHDRFDVVILARSRVDVVISDLGMGAGMNGWELAASLRTLPDQPHFIRTTGWGAEIDPEEAAERGAVAVVSKPYRLLDLRKILTTL
jgi:CheY-like chemotaxis protein